MKYFVVLFREVSVLRRLTDVPEVAQLVCYDVVFSHEGVLLIMVFQRGEINLSKYLENTKQLSRSVFFFLWEGILACISALNRRLKNILTIQNNAVWFSGTLFIWISREGSVYFPWKKSRQMLPKRVSLQLCTGKKPSQLLYGWTSDANILNLSPSHQTLCSSRLR